MGCGTKGNWPAGSVCATTIEVGIPTVAGNQSSMVPVMVSIMYVRWRWIVATSSASTSLVAAWPERLARVSESVRVKTCPAWDTDVMTVPWGPRFGYGSAT